MVVVVVVMVVVVLGVAFLVGFFFQLHFPFLDLLILLLISCAHRVLRDVLDLFDHGFYGVYQQLFVGAGGHTDRYQQNCAHDHR